MSSVDCIVDIDVFSKWLGLQTMSSKDCLNSKIREWSNDEQKLTGLSTRFRRFKQEMKKDPGFFKECNKYFKEISECEKELNDLITSDSDLEKESYNELLFFRPILKPLNFITYLLTFWSFIRVYLLPGLSFVLPFLTLLAPYFVLKFIFNMPMTLGSYMNILNSMISGNFEQMLHPNIAKSIDISPINFVKQFGIVMVTIVQGIVQPYWTYKHLKSIDDIVVEKGELVLRFKNLYNKLRTSLGKRGFKFFKCPLPDIQNERDGAAYAILESSYFKMALKYIGSLEVIMCMANQKDIHHVKWVKSDKPVFIAKDTFDFQVSKERKTISIDFDKQHALLTGPNKGGKSTVLRALSISALLAHTYGCSLGYLTLTPFNEMFVCLKPDDLPGSKSRFEREIEFTAKTLHVTKPSLIFIDELYHSTNPPDAIRSCQIYCDQLWKKPNIVSVISTHLFDLVEKAPNTIQKLCCPATIYKNTIHFSYTLNKGICKVSSVDELLKINGLLHRA